MVMRRRSTGPGRARGQRGMALVLALVLVALGLAVGAAIAGNLLRATAILRRQVETVQLDALLDAGMATAMAEIAWNGGWPGTVLTFEAGTVTIGAERVGLTFRVDLDARYRGRSRRIEASLEHRVGEAPRVTEWKPVVGTQATP